MRKLDITKLNFRRIVTAETRRKIGQALKGRLRGGSKKRVAAKATSGAARASQVNRVKGAAAVDRSFQQGMTGYRPSSKGAASRTKGAAADKSARQGFTGYVSKSKSKQNKYTDNLRKVLKG